MLSNLTEEEKKAYKRAFDAFDKDKDSTIDTNELGMMMQSMGYFPTEKQLQDMMTFADEDGSGKVEFGEFLAMMAKHSQKLEKKVPMVDSPIDEAMLSDVSALLTNISAQIEALTRNQDTILRRIVRVEEEATAQQQSDAKAVPGIANSLVLISTGSTTCMRSWEKFKSQICREQVHVTKLLITCRLPQLQTACHVANTSRCVKRLPGIRDRGDLFTYVHAPWNWYYINYMHILYAIVFMAALCHYNVAFQIVIQFI